MKQQEVAKWETANFWAHIEQRCPVTLIISFFATESSLILSMFYFFAHLLTVKFNHR